MQIQIQLFLATTFILPFHLFSQSLTIDETINYLNKLSFENAKTIHDPNKGVEGVVQWPCDTYKIYSIFNIGKDGLMTVYSAQSSFNCKDQKDQYQNNKKILAKFFVEDIDLANIDNYNQDEPENSFQLQTVNKYNSISFPLRDDEDHKTSTLAFTAPDHYNKMKLYNAIKYVISSALEHSYVRNDKDDPFVERSVNTNIDNSSNNSTKSENKIQLIETNGVFTLSVNVNGLVLSFVLDSGAGESNISSDTENKLISKGAIKQEDYLNSGLYKLADGSITECKRVKISKVTVGGKAIYNVVASIGPAGSPNLLGQSFLRKFKMWSIDNLKKSLIIE